MKAPDPLTLLQIQKMTGHESTDAIRMALRRGGVKSNGVRMGLSWPPQKIYECADVWSLFHVKILERARESPELKETCWEYFGPQIREASAAQSMGDLFTDKTQ